jgi:hypothetical protein
MGVASTIAGAIAARRRSWLAIVVGVFAGFHAVQLALLVWRFEALPNYLTVHAWPANIARIARATPSVSDMIPIMLDEWLIEVGRMNYAFGRGIAEWSFVLVPAKALVVLAIAMLVATNLVLLRKAATTCSLATQAGGACATAGAAAIAALAVTSITWVVCCAAPTWVVALAVMGVGVSTALALAPLGGSLSLVGLAALAATAILLARHIAGRAAATDQALAAPLVLTPVQIAQVPS